MPDNSPSILSLGEVLWDMFPEGPQFGGAPANFACHAAALGAKVSLASAVGADDRGRNARSILEGFGVDVRTLQVCPEAPTGTVKVTLNDNGKPTYVIEEDAAWDHLAWNDDLAASVAGADAVYFGTLGQRCGASRKTIRRVLCEVADAGIPRILDVNLRAPFFDEKMIAGSVELASVLKLSDEELPAVLSGCRVEPDDDKETALRGLLHKCALDIVVMTLGPEGAVVVSPDETCWQPGIAAEVVDTVGAGDSFTAAFITGMLRGEALARIAYEACELAAMVCSKPGAVPNVHKHIQSH